MSTYLSRVTTKPKILPPRMGLIGPHGSGKTTLATDGDKALLQPVEEGEGIIKVARLPRPESWADMMNVPLELATEKHDHKIFVVDSIDHAEPLAWQHVCEQGGKPNIEAFGYGKGYVLADQLWIDWFRALDALRQIGMTVIVIAHTEDKVVDDTMIGSYTRSVPKLHKRATALFCEWADLIGFLTIERTARDVGKDGGRETRTSRSTGQRILYTEDRGGFVAKNRYNLPSEILIPKEHPYSALRAEILKALGLDTPKPKTAKKEVAA